VTFAIHAATGPAPAELHVAPGEGAAPFPSADWRDFPVVVLGWWLHDYATFRRSGSAVTSSFMNGPYALVISPAGDGRSVVVSFVRRTPDGAVAAQAPAVVPEECYATALTDAASAVAAAAAFDDPDLPALTAALAALR
jgi:hypothetical protein